MTALISPKIEREVAVWRELKHLLPDTVNRAIEQRVDSWQYLSSARALVQKPVVPPVPLVMRPGTIPRPIDGFFFEITNHK